MALEAIFTCGMAMKEVFFISSFFIPPFTIGVEAIEIVHENFQVLDFQWSSDGMFLNVMDKDTFCLAFPIPI